jgi:hypothetical protein
VLDEQRERPCSGWGIIRTLEVHDPALSCLGVSGNGEKSGEKLLYLPVENSAGANPNTV